MARAQSVLVSLHLEGAETLRSPRKEGEGLRHTGDPQSADEMNAGPGSDARNGETRQETSEWTGREGATERQREDREEAARTEEDRERIRDRDTIRRQPGDPQAERDRRRESRRGRRKGWQRAPQGGRLNHRSVLVAQPH